MRETSPPRPAITGMGVFCAGGYGTASLCETLREAPAFDPAGTAALLAEVEDERFAAHVERLAGDSAAGRVVLKATRRERVTDRLMLLAALEAWSAAGLSASTVEEAQRIGCVVAANNHFDHDLETSFADGSDDGRLVNPRERLACLDPYALGLLSRVFGFMGHAATVGAQSACSASAVVHAVGLLRCGLLDHCLVVAPAFFPSDSFRKMLENLGIVSRIGGVAPVRPFDSSHAGTSQAPIAAAVVLSAESGHRPGVVTVEGVGGCLHRSTGTDPDLDGEVRAMRGALRDAKVAPSDIGYVNAHATGTPRGDEVEALAIAEVFSGVERPPLVNGTKAIVGHGFNAAGLVGIVATCLQLTHGFVHETPGLVDPIADLAWSGRGRRSSAPLMRNARDQTTSGVVRAPGNVDLALCNTFSFFGINTSVVLSSRNG